MKKAIKIFFKYMSKAMKLLFIVFILFLGSLFVREQRLPDFILDFILERVSNDNLVIDCKSAYFSFNNGFRLQGLTIFCEQHSKNSFNNPVSAAKSIHYDFFGKELIIDGLEYKRLPDSYYYIPESTLPLAPLEFDIPNIKGLSVTLNSPQILGLTPDTVSCKVKTVPDKKCIVINDVRVDLPGRDCDTIVTGDLTVDLENQKIRTKFGGAATQRQIRPLLEALDIQCSLPYMDAFTDIYKPVDADCKIEVDLFTLDFYMLLNLDVTKMGKYNLVPMAFAKGGLLFYSKIKEDKRIVALKVFVDSSENHANKSLSGWLTVDDFSGRYKLDYDVKNELDIESALKIADFMDPSLLSFVNLGLNSLVTVKGRTGTSSDDIDLNSLRGEFKAQSGALDGYKYVDLAGRYSFEGDVVSIDAEMKGISGGKVKFSSGIFCEKFEDDKAHFKLKGSYQGGSLKELADAFSFDLGERKGDVDIDLDISGKVSTNIWQSVDGRGRAKITNGHLARMKLFSGLTGLLAERVPGISFLVDQTQASADFTFDNGVFITDNLYIEGGLVSVKGWGRYDIAKDNLDFVARVQFAKKESIASKIIHPLTYPFTKLLLEFKVTGPMDNPKWEHIEIADRIF